MKSQGNRWIIGACLASLLLLAICDTAAAFRLRFWRPAVRQGPPAHAPAHGYRRKQVCGHDLIFDAGLGVYVVVGQTDVYYHEGHFYRVRGAVWEISLRADIWEPAGIDKLPPGLQIKAKSLTKVNGNGNSIVKLNGNGNSLVKLNGNGNGNNGKPDIDPGNNGNKSNASAAGSGQSPVKTDNGDNKPAKPGADTDSNKLNGNNPTKPGANGNTNKPNSRPVGNGKAKPASRGRKK